jgi:hypothetical protein
LVRTVSTGEGGESVSLGVVSEANSLSIGAWVTTGCVLGGRVGFDAGGTTSTGNACTRCFSLSRTRRAVEAAAVVVATGRVQEGTANPQAPPFGAENHAREVQVAPVDIYQHCLMCQDGGFKGENVS